MKLYRKKERNVSWWKSPWFSLSFPKHIPRSLNFKKKKIIRAIYPAGVRSSGGAQKKRSFEDLLSMVGWQRTGTTAFFRFTLKIGHSKLWLQGFCRSRFFILPQKSVNSWKTEPGVVPTPDLRTTWPYKLFSKKKKWNKLAIQQQIYIHHP